MPEDKSQDRLEEIKQRMFGNPPDKQERGSPYAEVCRCHAEIIWLVKTVESLRVPVRQMVSLLNHPLLRDAIADEKLGVTSGSLWSEFRQVGESIKKANRAGFI